MTVGSGCGPVRARGLALATASLERRRHDRLRRLAWPTRTALHDRRCGGGRWQLGRSRDRRLRGGHRLRGGVVSTSAGANRTQDDAAVGELQLELVTGREAELLAHSGRQGEPAVEVEADLGHGRASLCEGSRRREWARNVRTARIWPRKKEGS